MGKRQVKQESVLAVLLRGTIVALIAYLAGIAILAALAIRGVVPETTAFPVLAVLCFFSVFLAAGFGSRGLRWGSLPSAVVMALIFGGVLIAVGAACWQGITWTGNGGRLLLVIVGAGGAGGLLGGSRKRGKRKK